MLLKCLHQSLTGWVHWWKDEFLKNVVQKHLEDRWGVEEDTHSRKKDCLITEFLKKSPFIHLFCSFDWASLAACGILVPRLGIEPVPPAMETWSLTQWTAREIPLFSFYCFYFILEYSWLMTCWFQVNSNVIQLCIYSYLFYFKFFPRLGCYIILSRVPCSMQ